VPSDGDYERFRMLTGVQSWMVTVILARELFVTSVRGVLEGRGVAFGAEWAGKLKMVLQSITAPICLAVAVNEGLADSRAWTGTRDALVWATVVLTLWSAWPYVRRTGLLWSDGKGSE
jgi:CDP-diacylglycerol--glycerol-3-phosphate 3-phosphatidyltransferase